MNYIATVIVEPSAFLPEHQKAGGVFFVATGGIPGSDACYGPWSEQQLLAINKGALQYLILNQNNPQISINNDMLKSMFSKPNCFIKCFYTDSYEKDRQCAHSLYDCLVQSCKNHEITVSLFESI